MGSGNLSNRTDGQTILSTFFNSIHSALNQDHVPRNATGVATDGAGSLGSTSFRWLNLFVKTALKLASSGTSFYANIQAPAGLAADVTLKLPAALPGSTLPMKLAADGSMSAVTIGTSDVADGAITPAKRSTQIIGISSNVNTPWAGTGDVTNLTVTITTTGRPVAWRLAPGITTSASQSGWLASDSAGTIGIKRNGTVIPSATDLFTAAGYYLAGGFSGVDTGASSGSNTYQVTVIGNAGTLEFRNVVLIAYEL